MLYSCAMLLFRRWALFVSAALLFLVLVTRSAVATVLNAAEEQQTCKQKAAGNVELPRDIGWTLTELPHDKVLVFVDNFRPLAPAGLSWPSWRRPRLRGKLLPLLLQLLAQRKMPLPCWTRSRLRGKLLPLLLQLLAQRKMPLPCWTRHRRCHRRPPG